MKGLTRFAVLFVIDLATRRVEIAGILPDPDSAGVIQCGRQLTDPLGAVIGLLDTGCTDPTRNDTVPQPKLAHRPAQCLASATRPSAGTL